MRYVHQSKQSLLLLHAAIDSLGLGASRHHYKTIECEDICNDFVRVCATQFVVNILALDGFVVITAGTQPERVEDRKSVV